MTDASPIRAGVYGGGFDPVHLAHLTLAETAREALPLDRVIFLPSGGKAHYKSESNVASGEHRLAMLRLATAHNPSYEVSDYEIRQGEFRYTIDTLRSFRREHPEWGEIVLLIGGDWMRKLHTWKEGDRLTREFSVAVFSRPGFELERQPNEDERLYTVEMPLMEISSSDIRRRLREGLDVSEMVPEAVNAFIEEHGLYR
ncbi:MAG: nicotinate (nicotinamide) nucleotide adenylyltransferase [bacterium]|nr:nicotinate (nicotinamide) nucleotide adenylyltransferase [bacterium]